MSICWLSWHNSSFLTYFLMVNVRKEHRVLVTLISMRWTPSDDQGSLLILKVLKLFNHNSYIRAGQFSSVTQSCLTLPPHGLQHTRPPCPAPTPRVYSNSCPLSQWCHPTISSSVVPFSSHLQPFPASGSFSMSQFFTSGGQSIGVSTTASVLPMNIQDWFTLGYIDYISFPSKGLSRVFSNTTVQKNRFFGAQFSL